MDDYFDEGRKGKALMLAAAFILAGIFIHQKIKNDSAIAADTRRVADAMEMMASASNVSGFALMRSAATARECGR